MLPGESVGDIYGAQTYSRQPSGIRPTLGRQKSLRQFRQ